MILCPLRLRVDALLSHPTPCVQTSFPSSIPVSAGGCTSSRVDSSSSFILINPHHVLLETSSAFLTYLFMAFSGCHPYGNTILIKTPNNFLTLLQASSQSTSCTISLPHLSQSLLLTLDLLMESFWK